MKIGLVISTVVVIGLAVAGWFYRDTPIVRRASEATGLGSGDSTPATGKSLAAAGVHKCQTAGGIVYVDHACPRGSRELSANGGAVTVMSFPKAAPPPDAPGSGLLGAPLVKGMSVEERDRLREKQIDDAANRR